MVYYFTSTVVKPSGYVYVGKDKFENEELIQHGWEEDVCCLGYENDEEEGRLYVLILTPVKFHVDKLSSAHIYLRLREGESWDNIAPDLLTDLCQLTKANSIEGNKKDNISVIYTPWSNLKKNGSMVTGQVGFHDDRKVKRFLVAQRENAIVNRLNKTKVEKYPDLKAEKDEHLRQIRKKEQHAQQERKKQEAVQKKEWEEEKWRKEHAYDDIFSEDNLAASNNQDRDETWEEDFM